MPVQPDEKQRIARLRADLLDLGLEWNKRYRLTDDSKLWRLEYMKPTTAKQYTGAEEAVKTITNS